MQMWCAPSLILIPAWGDVLFSCHLISSPPLAAPHLFARTNWSAWSWSLRRRRAALRWWLTAWAAAETRLNSCARSSCRRDPPNKTWSWTRAPWRDRYVHTLSLVHSELNEWMNPWPNVICSSGRVSILSEEVHFCITVESCWAILTTSSLAGGTTDSTCSAN